MEWEIVEVKRAKYSSLNGQRRKKGIKANFDNPGGIILDYGEHEITDEILAVVRRRIERSNLSNIDVIFLPNGKLIQILRYKK